MERRERMYRPEGWREKAHRLENLYYTGLKIPELIEMSADAILEGLKSDGKHTDGLAPTLSINVSPGQKGTLVFIPEEPAS